MYNSLLLYEPKFRASKNKELHDTAVEAIKAEFEGKVKAMAENRVEALNSALKSKTGLSLKYYIRNI